MKNKLVTITPYFYPHHGGVENYSYHMSRMMKKICKWDVVIITTKHTKTSPSVEMIDGMKVYRLPFWFKISNSPINPLWFYMMRKIIKKEKPTVINAHSPVLFMADVASYIRGTIPFILTYHSGPLKKGKFLPDMITAFYEKYFLPILFRKSDRVIFSSVKPIITNINLQNGKTYCIPPGVDISTFKPQKQSATNTILYVGRIEKSSQWKGITYLLDAVAVLVKTNPDIRLHIVGDGDALAYYRNYTRNIGIEKHVLFLGFLSGGALRNEYAKASVVVLPSTSDAESFGMVLIEAMAMKKPVIGTRVGGVPYIIDHSKTGILVQPKDASSLAQAIQKTLEDKKLARKLGNAGYKKVISSFQWESQAKKFITVSKSIIKNKQKTKLLLVTPYFPSHIGGVELYVKNIAERLVKTYDVDIAIITSNHVAKKTIIEKRNNITIYRLPHLFTFSNTPINPFWYFQIKNIIKKENPDIINAHAPVPFMADIAAMVSGTTPFILTYHTGKMKKKKFLHDALLIAYEKLVFRYTCKKAKKIICSSAYVQKQFANYLRNKTTIISPGVDTSLFRPIKKPSRYHILFVGSLRKTEKYKGLDILITSFAKIQKQFPNATLEIVGDGDAKKEYEYLAQKLHVKNNILFTGVLFGKKLVAAYNRSDVLVLPSLFESFGMVFIEAMACKIPVIGTKVGGIPDVITHNKNGLLVEPGNVSSLTKALVTLFSDKKKAISMGENGYKLTREKFSWDMQVHKTYNAISSVLTI